MNDHSRWADAGFGISLVSYVLSHITAALPALQALALIATIISGFAAAYFHLKNARKL